MAEGHVHFDNKLSENLTSAFIIGIVLNVIFVIIEILAGIYCSSLALLSDAGHNFIDISGLILSLLAIRMTQRKPCNHYTYGFKKLTVLSTLINSILLLFTVSVIIVEAFYKFNHPQSIDGGVVMWVAMVGVVINSITTFLFWNKKEKELNAKSAYLHMLADAAVSVMVVISGFLMLKYQYYWIDPIISIVIALVILKSTWTVLVSSIKLSIDGVPLHLKKEEVKQFLMNVKGIKEVHELHIWNISTFETVLTAHLLLKDNNFIPDVNLINKELDDIYHINYSTIQFEKHN